jgi:hypothetical protein
MRETQFKPQSHYKYIYEETISSSSEWLSWSCHESVGWFIGQPEYNATPMDYDMKKPDLEYNSDN